jgi:hypothetical protein
LRTNFGQNIALDDCAGRQLGERWDARLRISIFITLVCLCGAWPRAESTLFARNAVDSCWCLWPEWYQWLPTGWGPRQHHDASLFILAAHTLSLSALSCLLNYLSAVPPANYIVRCRALAAWNRIKNCKKHASAVGFVANNYTLGLRLPRTIAL